MASWTDGLMPWLIDRRRSKQAAKIRRDLAAGRRKRPVFFEHVRERIEPQLEALGFLLTEERYVPGSFGSALAVYHRPGTRFRLVWDGKERALSGDVASDRGNTWQDIERRNVGAAQPLPLDHERTKERVERLVRAVENVLGLPSNQEAEPSPSDAMTCCFCGESIPRPTIESITQRTTIDPCVVRVSTIQGIEQMFVCHAECLKTRLARTSGLSTPAPF